MLSTTDAIVLALQPHSDKAHVLHAYTRAGGRINYMVYGLGRKNAIGQYTPLSLLQITADHEGHSPIALRTAQMVYTPISTHTDPYKQSVALFLSEVLYHTLRHPMRDERLFEFISRSVRGLDKTDRPQDFHLLFLIEYAGQLGFAIDETAHPELVRMPLTRTERQQQLRKLCTYFSEHADTWKDPRSLDILMEIFDE